LIYIHKLILQGHAVAEHAAENGDHAAGSGGHEGLAHLQNIVALFANYIRNALGNNALASIIDNWVNIIYSFAIMALLLWFFIYVARHMTKHPGRLQNAVEYLFGGLDSFVQDVLGPQGRKYVPLVGTLFIYILIMNLNGLIPILGHSPSSSLNVTLSLALFVFVTVQLHGIKALGILGYLRHFADLPEKNPHPVQIILAPLMFFLHVIGELAKPVSLSLRLFGNITGEDVLVAVFVTLLAGYLIPTHIMIYPIVLLGSFIQALVFALLTTVYLLLMSPHAEEH